jgi:hypothetical protein
MYKNRNLLIHILLLIFVSLSFGFDDSKLIYEESFDGYSGGVDPVGWTDLYSTMETSDYSSSSVYRLTGSVGTSGFAFYNNSQISALDNYIVEAAIYKNAGVIIGLSAGISSNNQNYYSFVWSPESGRPRLMKYTNGSGVTLGWGDSGVDWNWDYRLFRLEVKGKLITAALYSKINSESDWSENNLLKLSSIVYTENSTKLKGNAGLISNFVYSQATHAQADFFKVHKIICTYETTFENYTDGSDPTGWVDSQNIWQTKPTTSSCYYAISGQTAAEGFTYYNGPEITSLQSYLVDCALSKNMDGTPGVIAGLCNNGLDYYLFRLNPDLQKLELAEVRNNIKTIHGYGTKSNIIDNLQPHLFRLKVQNNKIEGLLYSKIDKYLDWSENNMIVVDSVSKQQSSSKLAGGSGLYAKTTGNGYDEVYSNYFKVISFDLNVCQDIADFGYTMLGDLNEDCHVDYSDLILFTEQWLTCNNPFDADCLN